MDEKEDVERENLGSEKRKRNGRKKMAGERSRNAAYLYCEEKLNKSELREK